MITANFIHRTFRIKCGESVGTGFTVDVDGKQYLVTARHVVRNFFEASGLEVFGNGVWTKVQASLVGHGPNAVDVSVLAPAVILSASGLPVKAASDGLGYGQDAYFLGFPYGVLSQVIVGDAGRPLPLVKKATVSAFAGDMCLLDGHNNPGFSGGPVVFGCGGTTPDSIAAVISGYRFAPEPVFLNGAKTLLTYQQNTGIIYSFRIEAALNLIRANPVGALVG